MVKCLPGSSATPLILFLWENTGPIHLDLFKPTSLAMPVRHRPGRSSSVTLWPVEETDFLPVSFLMAVGVCTLWLAQIGKMHFSLWRPWCLVAILIQYVPIILFCVLLPNPRSPKKTQKSPKGLLLHQGSVRSKFKTEKCSNRSSGPSLCYWRIISFLGNVFSNPLYIFIPGQSILRESSYKKQFTWSFIFYIPFSIISAICPWIRGLYPPSPVSLYPVNLLIPFLW